MKIRPIVATVALLLVTVLSVSGCKSNEGAALAEVGHLVEVNLKPGDSAATIEDFFVRNNIAFGFDRFGQKYDGRRPFKTDWKGMESVILIRIYVNPDRSFKTSEVEMAYTWL